MDSVDRLIERVGKQRIRDAFAAAHCRVAACEILDLHVSGSTLKAIMMRLGISTSHFDVQAKNRRYSVVVKQCPVCGDEFKTQVGHRDEKTTCSGSCANTYEPFSRKRHTAASNQKRREAMLGRPPMNKGTRSNRIVIRACQVCSCDFKARNSRVVTCGKSCGSSLGQRRAILNGTHKGWKTRTKFSMSFAEQIVASVLNEMQQSYQFDYPVNGWFIDFAFPDRMIAVEIDGQQHQRPERLAKDRQKDAELHALGWTVYRIPWKKPTPGLRTRLHQQLNQILNIGM